MNAILPFLPVYDAAGARAAAAVHADARLIAAAPDMLAALVALVPSDFDEHPDDFSEDWHAARAAIAKARAA